MDQTTLQTVPLPDSPLRRRSLLEPQPYINDKIRRPPNRIARHKLHRLQSDKATQVFRLPRRVHTRPGLLRFENLAENQFAIGHGLAASNSYKHFDRLVLFVDGDSIDLLFQDLPNQCNARQE